MVRPTTRKPRKYPKAEGLGAIFLKFLAAFTLLAAAAAFLSPLPWTTLRWMSLAGGALLGLAAISSHNTREFPILAAIAALAVSLPAYATQIETPLAMTEQALIVTAGCLMIALLLRSRTALVCSLFASGFWLMAQLPVAQAALGLTVVPQNSWWPIALGLLLWQAIIALNRSSALGLFGVSVLFYGWAAFVLSRLGVPPMPLAGLLFALGGTQMQWGQVAASTPPTRAVDQDKTSWSWGVGGVVAAGTALYLQTVWLDPTMNAADLTSGASPLWWGVFGGAAFTGFIASMVAYKSDTVSLFGAFLLVGLMAIIPLISIFPANVHGVLSLLAGFSPAPGFGIVLGAGILAAALFWVVKSLLNGNTLGLIAGAALFGFEIILLGRYDVGLESLDLGTLDFVVLFGASLIAALAVGGLVTGRLDRAEASAR